MRSDEVRTSYLKFFEERGHVVYPSDLVYPQNDPSLLFTSAGMTQFKDMFLGVGRLPFSRAVTSQKCLRMPDIEKVGKTASHHTFFEMLGNFSFGDYFKEETIAWAWELLLEQWGLKAEQFVITIYEDDEEAHDIWRDKIGIPEEKILRFGESENFWPANAPSQGPNGVCGPCSEIHYDYGPGVGCGRPDCDPSCDCDRLTEIWNLVFTQFNRLDGGKLEPLPRKNIDTGLGLERATRVLQGKRSNFETDLFIPIIERLCDIAGVVYDPESDGGRRARRVSDHMRALCVAIADGVFPSNEGRGYVIRRLLRRAVSDGNYLGVHERFLDRLVEPVLGTLASAFPELTQRRGNIERILVTEEEKFRTTLDAGTEMLEDAIARLETSGEKVLAGRQAFRLYDTYGFPLEMTQALLAERGYGVDVEGFRAAMERQREASRSASAISADIFSVGILDKMIKELPATRFAGYEVLETEAKVLALATSDGQVESVDSSVEREVSVVLDVTPFYGEAGGQVGDTGRLAGQDLDAEVSGTTRMGDVFVHACRIRRGAISPGQTVKAEVDARRRLDIMANHTATHLLHWALRSVLGENATQSGSLVAPDRLRFDFAHAGPVSEADLDRIEQMVNERIMGGSAVGTHETTLKSARAEGVTALFGEKYGQDVRVVEIGDFSRELCGGTHARNVAEIGLFKILSEEGIASGIRRITAVTRLAAYEAFRTGDGYAQQTARVLGVKREELPQRVESLLAEIKDLRKQMARKRQTSGEGLKPAEVVEMGGIKLLVYSLNGVAASELRSLADETVKGAKGVACVLATVSDKGISVVVAASGDVAARGAHAGRIARKMAERLGGGGGGRPTMGQAGGSDLDGLPEAIEEAKRAFREVAEGD